MNNIKNAVISIGTFDGVHLGHQYLLNYMVKMAQGYNKKSIVITYLRHPIETVHDHIYPYLITDFKIRERLIKKTGIDEIFYIDFTPQFASMSAETFLSDYLIPTFEPQAIITGYDTHFGKDRKGDYELLERLKHRYHFDVYKTEPYMIQNNLIVSSSLIRDFIRNGMIELANKYLGHYYTICGHVAHGKKIGRLLGYPTINLKPEDPHKLLPKSGVYLSLCKKEDQIFYSVTNIGVNPSVKDDQQLSIESHLIDFQGDLYTQNIELFLISRIRDEKKFDSKYALVKQIEEDISYARNYFVNFSEWNKII